MCEHFYLIYPRQECPEYFSLVQWKFSNVSSDMGLLTLFTITYFRVPGYFYYSHQFRCKGSFTVLSFIGGLTGPRPGLDSPVLLGLLPLSLSYSCKVRPTCFCSVCLCLLFLSLILQLLLHWVNDFFRSHTT